MQKLIVEFQQYETFLRTIEERIYTLRSMGKHDAAKRLEQQYNPLKVKIGNEWNRKLIICYFVLESIYSITK